jgi:hypothetical protein
MQRGETAFCKAQNSGPKYIIYYDAIKFLINVCKNASVQREKSLIRTGTKVCVETPLLG